MKKGIVTDTTQDENTSAKPASQTPVSEELQEAIHDLILQMRRRGPLKGF